MTHVSSGGTEPIVAALFVQKGGVYYGLENWRDAWGGCRESWTASKDKPRGPNGERRRASQHLGLTSTTPPEFRDALIAIARSARTYAEAVA